MYSNQDYLSELLVEGGVVTPEEIEKAREGVSANQGVVDLLVAVGDVTEEKVALMEQPVLVMRGDPNWGCWCCPMHKHRAV